MCLGHNGWLWVAVNVAYGSCRIGTRTRQVSVDAHACLTVKVCSCAMLCQKYHSGLNSCVRMCRKVLQQIRGNCGRICMQQTLHNSPLHVENKKGGAEDSSWEKRGNMAGGEGSDMTSSSLKRACLYSIKHVNPRTHQRRSHRSCVYAAQHVAYHG